MAIDKKSKARIIYSNVFDKICAIVAEKTAARRLVSGRPPKLSVPDQVLLTLEYWRELGDKGYDGLEKRHKNSRTPKKKPKGGELTKEEKACNREINRVRIVIEHILRNLKIFRILESGIGIGASGSVCVLT